MNLREVTNFAKQDNLIATLCKLDYLQTQLRLPIEEIVSANTADPDQIAPVDQGLLCLHTVCCYTVCYLFVWFSNIIVFVEQFGFAVSLSSPFWICLIYLNLDHVAVPQSMK